MSEITRAEFCTVAVADAFRGDGEILASSFGTVPAIGARLARLTFEPDLLMTDGIACLTADVPPVSGDRAGEPVFEGWMPFRSVFDLLWNGRRHVVMIAARSTALEITTSLASVRTKSRRPNSSACAAHRAIP